MTKDMEPLTSIAICGTSQNAWPVAALLSKSLPDHMRLIIVEDVETPVEITAATLPFDSPFHAAIGITTEDLILHCNGTFGLGTEYKGWHGNDSSFFAAPSRKLPQIKGVDLHHIMLRAAMMTGDSKQLSHLFQPFRFCTRAALAKKFDQRSNDPESPLTLLGPTIQFDRSKYTALLKDRFKSVVNKTYEAQPVSIKERTDQGAIQSVHLDNEENIGADLFVDVSGRLSDLLPEAAKPASHSLSDILPFDRIISAHNPYPSSFDHSNNIASAMTGGILFETPLQEGAISQLLYSSEHMTEADAQRFVAEGTEAATFTAHSIKNPWTKNLVRMGGASYALGPLLSSEIFLLQQQSLQLTAHIPTTQNMIVEATEFNVQQRHIFEEVRDFSLLPLVLNGRNDPLWQDIRQAKLPESLKIRINQFNSRGRYISFESELFYEQSWIDMMIDFGILPDRYDPMADTIDMNSIRPILKNIADTFTRTVGTMPSPAEYMVKFVESSRTTS